jgi:dihydrofolate reductase
MGKVVFGMAMSLDGFVNDKDGSVSRLYPDMAELHATETLQEAIKTTGAVVMGRRSYDMANGDFTGYEFQVPIFVVTHHVPEKTAKGENENLTFTFITDGVERAIEQAKAAAGDKDVTVIGGASIAQQLIHARLLDEIQISLMPILLGEGLRLCEHFDPAPIELEQTKVFTSSARTDITFRVAK